MTLHNTSISVHVLTMGSTSTDYSAIVKRMAELGLSGGVIYEALIAKAAQKSGADRILTFNADDFRRIWPEGISLIRV